MSETFNRLFLELLRSYKYNKCAPYDWSFSEQNAVEKMINFLEQIVKPEPTKEGK